MNTKNPFEGLDDIPTAPEPSQLQPRPVAAPMTQAAPLSEPAPAAPANPTSGAWQPTAQTTPKKSRRVLWLAGLGIILVGLLGGGYFAYSKGYLAIPFISPKSEELFEKMIASMSEIKNAQYSIRVGIAAEPVSGGTTPIFINTNNSTSYRGVDQALPGQPTALLSATPYSIENVGSAIGLGEADLAETVDNNYLMSLLGLTEFEEMFKTIPGDMNLSGGISVYVDSEKDLRDADAFIRIDGTYASSDMSVKVDLEARKDGRDIYGLVNNFPSFFFIDVSGIKGKWIKLTGDDGFDWIKDSAYEEFDSKKVAETLKSALRNALKEKVLEMKSKMAPESIAGVNSEHYIIRVNPENLTKLYDTLIREAEASQSRNLNELKKIREALNQSAVMDVLKRIADNSEFEVWIDKVNGYMRQTKWTVKVLPPAGNQRLEGKQFSLSMQMTMDKVNQSQNVDAPSSFIDADEATRLLTGITKEEQDTEKQIDQIRDLQSALKAFQKNSGSYPETLGALQPKLKELAAACLANSNTNSIVNYDDYDTSCYVLKQYDTKTIKITDVYTDKEYGYVRDGDDFKVTYQLQLGNSERTSYYRESYAEGTNTMTSKDLSLEKESSSEKYLRENPTNTNKNIMTDTDGDRLTDTVEQTYKTDPTKKDTDGDLLSDYDEIYTYFTKPLQKDSDGDQYDDGTEIQGGYNPNGPGLASDSQLLLWNKSTSLNNPVIDNVKISSSNGKAYVTWTTNYATKGQVAYKDASSSGLSTIISEQTAATSHRMEFPVASGVTYSYGVTACNSATPIECVASPTMTYQAP